jgi:hypothetical protein
MGKIFATYSCNRRLISIIYAEHSKLINAKRINNPINKWKSELKRQFSNEGLMANKYMGKMLNKLSHQINANQNYILGVGTTGRREDICKNCRG